MSKAAAPGYLRLFYNWKTLGEILFLAAFAFLFCFFSGQRGIFPLDQSIVFDGAHRILSGQRPFRDFVSPHSLLVFYYQALAFSLLGTNYFSYVCAAAFLNILAVLLAARIILAVFPLCRTSALIAAAITAVWFYSPFGTPFGEQSAFLLGMVGIDLLLTALLGADEGHPAGNLKRLVLAGVFAALAFYCKQNVALFLLPFFFLTPCVIWFPDFARLARSLSAILTGFVIGILLPVGFVAGAGSWTNFLYFYVLLPIATALRRFSNGQPWQGFSGTSLWLALVVILCVGLFSLRRRLAPRIRTLFEARTRLLRESTAAWLALYCLLLSHFLRRSMLNSPTMADLYIGVVIGLVYALTVERTPKLSRSYSRVFGVFVGLVFCFGVFLSWQRKVHESVKDSVFASTLNVQRLESLRWGTPTLIRDGDSADDSAQVDVTEQDVLSLIALLKTKNQNFFVFPDFTFLYGVLQKDSPQPLLFFHRGLTYPPEYDAAIDSWIVESLIAHQVGVVVLEQKSFFGTARRLADFPLLESFISANFVETRTIGMFKILELRGPDGAPA